MVDQYNLERIDDDDEDNEKHPVDQLSDVVAWGIAGGLVILAQAANVMLTALMVMIIKKIIEDEDLDLGELAAVLRQTGQQYDEDDLREIIREEIAEYNHDKKAKKRFQKFINKEFDPKIFVERINGQPEQDTADPEEDDDDDDE